MALAQFALSRTVLFDSSPEIGRAFTEKFPDLQRIFKSIKAKSAVLDGEIVALDNKGVPCFDGLRSR